MNKLSIWPRLVFLATLLGFNPAKLLADDSNLIDYRYLTHKITLEKLRAGNHDESGDNEYFFTTELFALVHSEEEIALELGKRKKLTVGMGEFGDVKIKSLQLWDKSDTETESDSLEISGEAIRELTSKMMKEHKTTEDVVTIMVKIKMFEKEKKFGLMGEDALISQANYYPIPPAFFRQADTKQKEITIKDDKGTRVTISVVYEDPTKKKKSKKQ
jgi:hypothetical protein